MSCLLSAADSKEWCLLFLAHTGFQCVFQMRFGSLSSAGSLLWACEQINVILVTCRDFQLLRVNNSNLKRSSSLIANIFIPYFDSR